MDISEFKNILWDYTRKINENANSIFNPICEKYRLTVLQIRILMELYKYQSHTIGSLAEGIYAAETNISSMCKKLENMGLLKRIRSQDDERVVKVALTERGNEVVSEMDRLLNEKISKNIGEETEEILESIVQGLRKLNDLLQKIVPNKGE